MGGGAGLSSGSEELIERLRIIPHGDHEPVEIVARLESEDSVANLRAAITGERS